MPRKPTCLFSYYGSKSKVAGKYPKPQHDTIIEPFAGGATYSLRYPERRVILRELNPKTFAIWDYLISTSIEEVLRGLPQGVQKGDLVTDMLGVYAPAGLVELCRSNCNMGTAGGSATWNRVSAFGALHWNQMRRRLEHFLPKIQHWVVTQGNYEGLTNTRATWFVDPPYDNPAGKRYACSDVDYAALADWCRARSGQTIVCENEGADWLPFVPLTAGRSRGGVRPANEVIWTGPRRPAGI